MTLAMSTLRCLQLQRPFTSVRRPSRRQLRCNAQKEGESVVNEDLLAKLKAAEEEAQRLKQELAAAKAQVGGGGLSNTNAPRNKDSSASYC